MQALRNNDFTMRVAQANPISLRDAIVQAAVLGVTLNPAVGHGYLVPYGDKVLFQPSYRGLRDIAIEEGLIKWCRAEVVHKNDRVTITEREDGGRDVRHEFDPFGDRGAIVGGFCAWEEGSGRRDCVFETIEEIYRSHRSRSQAFSRQGAGGIWKTDELEAIRKALTKRAQKSWPRRTDRAAGRFEAAVAAEFEGDSVETTATEVRRTPESARLVRPSATPHAGKAGSLAAVAPAQAVPAVNDELPSAAADLDALWLAIEETAATLGGGDLGKASEITAAARQELGLGVDDDLDAAQVERLLGHLRATAAALES